ncbi:hypothetical protein [Mycolicibacterium hodleri]|uniref:DUF732 domain-containing protein n=1 Tax=Mycolicibacterium hodleri TaxID=49897 RepID=A0A502E2G9_9MYCO|nr:hypothetical protein [Mycolicibacterium hodleri]TPG31885.1 hypothetical protein EAH80_21165 [Mycolicibacterium hodleri]
MALLVGMFLRIFAACLATGCLVSSCASRSPGYPAPASSQVAATSASAGTATRGGELGALTARGLVNALNDTGFAAPNPVDTTAQECPAAGCDQSIVTDTLRAKSFLSTAKAQTYAGDQGLYQVGTIVVAFAPPISKAEQARYWAHIQSLVR